MNKPVIPIMGRSLKARHALFSLSRELASASRGRDDLGRVFSREDRSLGFAKKKAPKLGLDPDRWFGNMEVVVSMHVGREPVRYVSNINKYYIAYSTMQQLLAEHSKTPLVLTEMQSLLNDKGYDSGAPDGVIGLRTRQAIQNYQQDHGLAETGQPSQRLMRHLQGK
jgi:Putative peptidoglycan binding domain